LHASNVPIMLAGKSIGILKFLGSDPCHCELGLDEAEPNVWFLLIVGANFNLSSCCPSDRVGQVFTSHSCRFGKCRHCPKSCGTLVPRAKNGSHCRARLCTKTQRARQGLNRKEICRSSYETHKIKWTNTIKGKNLILNLWAGLDGSPGSKTEQEKLATIQKKTSEKTSVVEPEPQGAKFFGRSQGNNDVSAPAPGSGSSHTREFYATN
jgi:hypothetical protein